MDNRYVSPDTWYDDKRQAVPARRPLLRRRRDEALRRRALPPPQGGLRRAPPPRRHLARLADLLRRARAVLHTRRAAATRCTARAARIRPSRRRARRIRTRRSRTSRGSSSSPTTSPRTATSRSTPLRDHARRVEHAVQHVHPLLDLRRLPVPRPRQVRRRGPRRAPRARAPERHAADEREGRQARHERRQARPSPRWSSSVTAARSGSRPMSWSSRAAPPTRPSCSCSRRTTSTRTASPTAPTRSGATTCSTTRRRCSRSRARRTRPSYQKTLGLNDFYFGSDDFEYPLGNIQMVGKSQAPMFRGERPRGDEARARVDAGADGAARDRLLALDRGPAAARQPGHRRPRRQAHTQLHGDERRSQEAALQEGQVDAREARHEPRPPDPPLRVHEERHPGGGCAHQAGTARFGTDPSRPC